MPEITRRASFYVSKRDRGPKTFHLETDGAVVNVTVGLEDRDGRQITRVDVSPDDETRGGDGEGRVWSSVWGDNEARLIRALEDEPRPHPAVTALRGIARSVRTQVTSGQLNACDASPEVQRRALTESIVASSRVTGHLLIDPGAPLVTEPGSITGRMTRVKLAAR